MDEPIFDDGLRVLAERLARLCEDRALASSVLRLVRERAPDERLALAFLLHLAELSPRTLKEAIDDQERFSDLVFCLGASELIGAGLVTLGSGWVTAFDQGRAESRRAAEAGVLTEPQSPAQLGERKREALLRIGIGDVLGRLTVSETVEAMSRLADGCIAGALAMAVRELKAPGLASRLCVLAMGKLGANELNLSSDIDLVYIVDDATDLAEHEAVQRLGERITEILSAQCFRVDLRLRPGGRSSPLVVAADAARNFYQNFGETWERAALLRARPVAGAIAAGQRLISELSRFVYRVYLDFDTIGQLREMKRRIEDELRSAELVKRNVKLGYGGIRELEFIIQALTLIYGGRDPRLRTPNTMMALERLEACGYMTSARVRNLAAAYLFLRNVEHKLQVAAGLQTHTLPADSSGLAILAARLGYGKQVEAVARFIAEMDAHRQTVAEQFRQMLDTDEGDARTAVPALAEAVWRVAADPEWSTPALTELGFRRPAESARHLQLLAQGPAHSPATARRRDALERLGPRLLEEMRGLADPDLALMHLASFMAAVGARSSFLTLLEEHPATRQVLLRLFASSDYLSAHFIRHPEMIDILVRSDLVRPRHARAEMAEELHALIEACEDLERRLDAIRAFRHQEFLRIAIADLAGELSLEEVQTELTLLAETVLGEALERARREAGQRHQIPPELKLSVLAMGRMGAGEMSYNSDLDLIFVYHLPAGEAAQGPEASARVVQQFIAFLQAATREGIAYKIDVRLRPSGNAGPLVASLEAFRNYHRQSSAMWERQALVRGRVVAGDRWLLEQVEAERYEFVFGRGLDAAGVDEIGAMRARIEGELGVETPRQLNLKQGPGGLLDVDFLAQMLALRYGQQYPALRQRSTAALLDAAGQHALLPAEQSASLIADYRYLTQLENRLRIENDRAVSALPTNRTELTPIAIRAGYKGARAADDLLSDLALRRDRVRAMFTASFARERLK